MDKSKKELELLKELKEMEKLESWDWEDHSNRNDIHSELYHLKATELEKSNKIIKIQTEMIDLMAKYEPLNTEDGYVKQEDNDRYTELSSKLRKIREEVK